MAISHLLAVIIEKSPIVLIMNRKLYIALIIMISVTLTSCLRFISMTPKNVNPKPVYNLEFNGNLDILSNINDTTILPKIEYTYQLNDNKSLLVKSINDTIKGYYRIVEISQYNTCDEALKACENSKWIFTRGLPARLYKEKGEKFNRYFVTYETIQFNYNHGLPIGFINNPEIVVGFLKNNIFTSVHLTSYNKKDHNYVDMINSDIIYLGEILKNRIKKDDKK